MVKDTDIIIGMGEIGKGLYEVINDSGTMVFGFDLNKETGKLKAYDIHDGSMGLSKAFVDLDLVKSRARLLHICIPGEVPCFHLVVADYIKEFNPEVTVIHSTVQVGTTTKLNKAGHVVVHSPVRGKHPNMAAGIRAYTKYLGLPSNMGHSKWSILMHAFEDYGLKFKSMSSPEATELAKILSTTRYGVNLLFADMQSSAIHDLSLDYKEVVTEWETTYNEGLDEVGMPQFKRPILTPPTYAIGGHCVYENVRILKDALPRFSPIQSMLMLIKEFGRLNYKEEKNDN